MAKRLSTEDHLALLRQLRAAPDAPTTLPALQQIFAAPRVHAIVLKSAATLAEQIGAKTLIPVLVAAAKSLMAEDSVKRDPGCEAKTAIVSTLVGWDADVPDFYLALGRYTQLESSFSMDPAFRAPKDTASEVRGLAAIGIARTRPTDAILVLTDLLADPEKVTRAHAARALGLWRGPEAVPLLRLKARLGDEDAETFSEVLGSLLRHDPRNHLAFVAEFLDVPKEATIEATALALGQSKIPTALQPLTDAYPRLRSSRIATTLLMAISLLRTPEAIEWLLRQLPSARHAEALMLLDALYIHHHDEKLLAHLPSLLEQHPSLQMAYKEVFRS
jgi:HEAT repeat protein